MVESRTAPFLLPYYVKDQAAEETTIINHSEKLHPIGKLIRERRFAHVSLGMSIALSIGVSFFRFDTQIFTPHFLSIVIASSLTLGAATVWNVQNLTKFFPLISIGVEKAGLGAIFFAFFTVVSSLLSKNIAWISWICLAIALISSNVTLLRPRIATQDHHHKYNWVG